MEEWSDFTGQFEARESVEVRARVSGYLESINFVDGQLVKKGDLLLVIEPRPFELALETSKGDLPLAMGLGLILIVIVLAINAAACPTASPKESPSTSTTTSGLNASASSKNDAGRRLR